MSIHCFSISDFTSIVSCIISGVTVFVAWKQLKNLAEQVRTGVENQKTDQLKIVLEIETQINDRKHDFDLANKTLLEYGKQENKDDEQLKILKSFSDTTKENYFNALDRLCFCIKKGYVDENEYKHEYMNMLRDTIKAFENDFGEASPYRHIKSINSKWQNG